MVYSALAGRPLRLCFFGDSLTAGVGDALGVGWVGRVLRAAAPDHPKLTGYPLGIRRDTIGDVLRRWQAEAAARLPETADPGLIFAVGTNDCTEESYGRRVALTESLAEFTRLLTGARQLAAVRVIGPPPSTDETVNGRLADLSDRMAGIAADLGIPYCEMYRPLIRDADWHRAMADSDGYHPTAAGYDRMAAIILGWPDWHGLLNRQATG